MVEEIVGKEKTVLEQLANFTGREGIENGRKFSFFRSIELPTDHTLALVKILGERGFDFRFAKPQSHPVTRLDLRSNEFAIYVNKDQLNKVGKIEDLLNSTQELLTLGWAEGGLMCISQRLSLEGVRQELELDRPDPNIVSPEVQDKIVKLFLLRRLDRYESISPYAIPKQLAEELKSNTQELLQGVTVEQITQNEIEEIVRKVFERERYRIQPILEE